MLLTANALQALIHPEDKCYEDQLFKHEFATSKCFWPKLKDCKSKDFALTNKVFIRTKTAPENFWVCFNTF
jgi:hypothetical protein